MDDCHIYKLPNELLLHLLVPIPTPQLLPLTLISHRFCALIIRILHNRIVAASELESHALLLECEHPSAQLTEPPYFCTYQGTDGLSSHDQFSDDFNNVGRLGELRNMFSRFRPHRRELVSGGRRVRGPPGDVPGSRTYPGTVQDKYKGESVRQTLNLDGHELFTQLCAQTNLVKIGPRNGLFACFVGVEEGVVRVWRHWLKDMAANGDAQADFIEETGHGTQTVHDVTKDIKSIDDANILWVSEAKNTGLRFNVHEKTPRYRAPNLISADEDSPVSYELEYDELIIRTSHLLLMLEKSMIQEDNSSGKAIVFGSFG